MKVVEMFTNPDAAKARQKIALFRTQIQSQENALAKLEHDRGEMLDSMPDVDLKKLATVRQSIADITAKLAESQAGLDRAERALAQAEQEEAEQQRADAWKQVETACDKRKATAAEVHRLIDQLGAAVVRLWEQSAAATSAVPGPIASRLRSVDVVTAHEVAAQWSETMKAAIEGRLFATSRGLVGIPAHEYRYNSAAEYLKAEPGLQAIAQSQNQALLAPASAPKAAA